MHRRLPAFIAAIVLSGCAETPPMDSAKPGSAAAARSAPPATSRPVNAAAHSVPRALDGLDCDGAATGCTVPGYAISGSIDACEIDGASFGAISDHAPVSASSRFHGTDVLATLAPGQFLCIHYTAQPTAPDGEPWLYVTAIPPQLVPACQTAHCGNATARSTWSDGHAGTCEIDGKRYGAGCPAGWVRGTSVDAYSMGL